MVDMTYRESEMDSLTLGFTTIALPATAFLWSSNGILLSLNGSDNYYTYTAGLTLSEPASALYTVTLQIHDQSRNNIEGNFLCEVYSSWMSADQSTDGRESKYSCHTSLYIPYSFGLLTPTKKKKKDACMHGNEATLCHLTTNVMDI